MTFSVLGLFGKYRALLLAITLFLVIDISDLVFNVAASREIERDASEINMAGELRMVSQQLAKSLLTLENEVRNKLPSQTSLAQIYEASDEFDRALATLQQSHQGYYGKVIVGGDGWAERHRLLLELAAEWEPLVRDVRGLLERKNSLAVTDILPVSNKSVSRNLKLLQLSDDLTEHMEAMSRSKTSQIRIIQLSAIILALLNFLFIVFRFIRQLSASDQRAASAQGETKKILDTVRQGLFLLHADGRIGDQHSSSMEQLFGQPILPQAHFVSDVLKPMLHNAEQLETASAYIDMLYDKKMKPSLLSKLNPLVEIEVETPADERHRQKFLSFDFEQVKSGEEVVALLISVFDVTQEVMLQRELAGAKARTKTEIELLLGVIDQDPALVQDFIRNTKERIEQVNTELQNVRPDPAAYARAINLVARSIHSIKGEAALLKVDVVELYAHTLEDTLSHLRSNRNLTGDDLIPVAVGVNELLDRVNRIEAIVGRVARFAVPATDAHAPVTADDPLTVVLGALEKLGAKVANDLGKEIYFELDFPPITAIPEELLRVCQEVLPQLVRNAIVHGIEDQTERLRNGKEAVGHVRVRFEFEGAAGYRVRVRDDGGGLSLPALRQRAVETGRYSERDIQQMGDHQVVSMLFEPGFSTLDEAHLHAGRGEGLAVVQEALQRIGARLRILSTPSAFTEFVIYKGA
jgi:two-component system chemotaxis sensor kinase CheA